MNFLKVFLASIVAGTYCMVGCVLFQSVLTTIVRGLATASVVVTTGTSICSSSRSLSTASSFSASQLPTSFCVSFC